MKKIFTLLFCLGTLSSVFAQYNRGGYDNANRDSRNNSYDWKRNEQPAMQPATTVVMDQHDGYNDHRFFDRRKQDAQIDRINWKYDAKINEVRRNPYMSYFQKNRIIDQLQHERAEQIRMVSARFSDRGYDRW